MKTLFSILLIAGLSYLIHLYLPIWWLFVLVAFIISFAFGDKAISSFFAGFIAIFLLWFALTTINSVNNDFVLVERMANVLPFKNAILLIISTSLIGGLLGGFGSMTGYFFKTFND